MQLNRHRKKCDKPERPEAKKYVFKDGKFACCSCNRSFKHQSNANRHFKSCKGKENGKVMLQCPRCPKTFEFQHRLACHLRYHPEQSSKTCTNCKRVFKRKDHFKSHMITCIRNEEIDQFVPSFTTPSDNVEDQDALVPTSEPSIPISEQLMPFSEPLVPTSEPLMSSSYLVDFHVVPSDNDSLPVHEAASDSISETLDTTITIPPGTPIQQMKWKTYKESQRKSANLENIIKLLSSPIKRDVFKKVINKNSKTVNEILAYTTWDTTYEAKVCQAFLTELKELNRLKRFRTFHRRLNSLFHTN